jgi:chromosome partitioning protein
MATYFGDGADVWHRHLLRYGIERNEILSAPAKVVVLAHQKGGSCKTTSVMCMAGELGTRGHRVLVVDADAQETAIAWSRAASSERPFPAAVIGMSSFGDRLHREVQRQLGNYDFIIIDLPPSLEAVTPAAALLIADLAIVPVPVSPADFWATEGVATLIRRLTEVNPGLKTVILPTKVQRTAISRAVLNELGKFGFPVMQSRLSNRIAFQEAAISGSTPSALGRQAKEAANEVMAMTDEVLSILEGAQ